MFIDEVSQIMQPEFQVVIMSGYGNGMYPLRQDSIMPKGLLPLANKPMLYYPLQWVQKAGFTDVIIAVYPDAKSKISHYVRERYESTMKIVLADVPDGSGSAEALLSIRHLIKACLTNEKDFIVLSCDLITDIPPNVVIDSHRSQNNTVTMLLHDATTLEGPDRLKDDGELIAINHKTGRVVFSAFRSDIKDKGGFIGFRHSLLKKYSNISLHSTLRDAHLYVFKHWVINLIARNTRLISIKNDLLPLLMELQYRKSTRIREGIADLLKDSPSDIFEKVRDLSLSGIKIEPVVCRAVIQSTGFSGRANNVWKYSEINKYLCKVTPSPVPSTCVIEEKVNIGSDSLVGESVEIKERCSIKRSVLGNHVKVGKQCKISNSVIMDHAIIEDGVKLDSCVISYNAKVLRKSELKDCEVAGKFVVPAETKSMNEQFVKMMLDGE